MLSSSAYYFPYGRSKRFLDIYKDIARYYEVKNGAAWLVWQCKLDDGNQAVDGLPYHQDDILQEWGRRPDLGNKLSYFFDYYMVDSITYGVITDGVMQQTAEIKNANSDVYDDHRIIAHSIPGGTKTD